jgi:hypothetical protein
MGSVRSRPEAGTRQMEHGELELKPERAILADLPQLKWMSAQLWLAPSSYSVGFS